MTKQACTCGHFIADHTWRFDGPRRPTWAHGGCRADGCACKVFCRDVNYIVPSKALTPREKRDRLTRDGAKWLSDVAGSLGWRAMERLSCSESMATRLRTAIEDAAPYAEGGTLERLKGGELGSTAWRTLIAFLREQQYVFGDDTPCPTCGRKGAR